MQLCDHVRHVVTACVLIYLNMKVLYMYTCAVPPVVLAPPPLTATESTDTLLEFIVVSHPPPSHTNYLHEGRTLVGKHDIVDVGALLLKDVSRLGAGEYSLTVSNALGTGYNYTTLHILCKRYGQSVL